VEETKYTPFSNRLRGLMEVTYTTQGRLSEHIGKTRQTVSQYINGISEPGYDVLVKIAGFFGVSTDYLLGNEPEITANEERKRIYLSALAKWGDRAQMIVAIEELSECQKEICKILRGGENFPHLAEEIADATIMLEQLCLIFNLDAQVNACMDTKVRRLEKRIEGYSGEK